MPISSYFDLSKPGNYTVLAWGGEELGDFVMRRAGGSLPKDLGGKGWVAKPVALTIGTQVPPHEDRPDLAEGDKSSSNTSAQSDPADKEWAELMARAGRPYDNCILDAIRSPMAPNAVRLVVSLICIDLRHEVGGRETYMGIDPANYRVLIRDKEGKAVRLTEYGRKALTAHGREDLSWLWTGDAHGTVLPLDKMFSLREGQDYTVLASLPGERPAEPGWVALPVTIHCPKLEAAKK